MGQAYQCKWGCGFEHEHRGAMNIHEANVKKCPKLKEKLEGIKEEKPVQIQAEEKEEFECSEGGLHNFRALTKQEIAICEHNGHYNMTKICKKCTGVQ